MKKGTWAEMATEGAQFCCRVTPGARRADIARDGDLITVAVTARAHDGAANEAVTEALAHALGVAKTRLTLLRGTTSRDKVFRLD